MEGTKHRTEQENRRPRWMRLTVRDVPNAGCVMDGMASGLR